MTSGYWVRKLHVTSLAFGLLAAASAVRAAEPEVVVTIRPVHSLVAGLMEGVGTPRLLVEGAASPHNFSLKPSDVRAAAKAKVLVRVSESLEPFTVKLVKSLPKGVRIVTLEHTEGLTKHALRSGGDFETHDHGGKNGHRHRDHDHEHKPKEGAKTSVDGHIWLDPANARAMVTHLSDVLADALPGHGARIVGNASRMAVDLAKLENEIAAATKPLSGRPYVVFHDAYQYFERRFGLTPVGSISVSPEVPPSAKRLSQLRAKLAKLQATCVFAEPQFAPRVVDTVIEGTSVRKGTLDPLGAAIPAGPALYGTLLREMAASLAACLGSQN